MSKANQEKNFIDGLKEYFKGVKSEWAKIIWPEKNTVIAQTFIVLGIVIVFTILIYLIDIILKGLFSLIPTA